MNGTAGTEVAVHVIHQDGVMPNLLELLAARASGLLNLAEVGRDAGRPHTTLTRYTTLLETVLLVHRLPAWSPNLGKQLVKTPNLHVVDAGLL
jgi:uncharacterized protein